jgi:adenylate cyclase
VNVKVDHEDQIVRRFTYRTTLLEYFDYPPIPNDTELLALPAQALTKMGLGNLVPKGHRPIRLRFSEEIPPRSLHEIFVEDQWSQPPYRNGKLFEGKIVLVGAAGNQAEDRLRTPSGTVLAPSIHLSALNAALNQDFVYETETPVDLALIIGSGALAWLIGAYMRRPIQRLSILVASVAAFYGIAQLLYNYAGILPITFSPVLTLMASGLTWAAWEQVLDRLERQRTRRALERYVGQDVAHEVLDNPQTYLNALGGQRKEITILFSDVRGFTTRTETADPQALVAQLNEYFEAMVAIVYAHRGTLDKFIGDAVMAQWGGIVTEGAETDAFRAVSTVLKMREALQRLNQGWRARGIKEMKVGFGVNQGDAIVGNLGCEAKMEVSVIGDAVNLGSRLEGVTKQYHIDLCIGENVAALVRNHFVLRSVDLIIVQGKTKPVEIFTVLGKRAGGEPSWLPTHEEAVRHYRAGRFADAEVKWREVLAQIPGDGLTEVMLDRCAVLQREPPEGEWTGVYEMKSK